MDEPNNTEKDNLALRNMLWLRHGCSISSLYGDDGKMHCVTCMIDFRRDPVEQIEARFVAISYKKLIEAGIVKRTY